MSFLFVIAGTDAEKTMACRLAGVLILQLGCSDEAKHYMEQLTSFLTTTLADHTKSQSLRAMVSMGTIIGNANGVSRSNLACSRCSSICDVKSLCLKILPLR